MSFRLYRHYNAAGELLYVGISLSSFARLAQHRDHSAWFAEITRVEFEPFETKESVLEAERNAIQKEQPKFNVHHKKLKPQAKVLDAEPVAESKRHLVASFAPVYTIEGAARALNLRGPTGVRRLIADGEINAFEISPAGWRITGWQLIEYLERQDAKQK